MYFRNDSQQKPTKQNTKYWNSMNDDRLTKKADLQNIGKTIRGRCDGRNAGHLPQ